VDSARSGVIVDNDNYLDMFKDVLTALQELAAAVGQIEARLRIVEDKCYTISEWEKIMIDRGFSNER
jgi:hypothetical protein